MKHYGCDHIGLVEEFAKEDGSYVCPKCKKSLKRVGIDYGMPGIGFFCRICNNFFQFPLINIICDKGHISKVDELNIKSFPIFKVNKEISDYNLTTKWLYRIEDALSKYNLKYEKFASIRGLSGKEYRVPLLVEYEKKKIIIDLIGEYEGIVGLNEYVRRGHYETDNNNFDMISERLFNIVNRSIDLVNVGDEYFTILLVPPQLAYRLYSILRMEKIKVVEVSDPIAYTDVIIEEIIKLAKN